MSEHGDEDPTPTSHAPREAALTGRALAERQLEDLERACGGDLEIVSSPGTERGPFLISINTDGIVAGSGIALRPRERFRVFVGDDFPFSYPIVFAEHTRWAGTAHVQWGDYLCLYAAASVEWNASEGMRGFLDRLLAWLENAAAGSLDPDDRPLHPPANDASARHGRLIVRSDLGDLVPWSRHGASVPVADGLNRTSHTVLFGWCVRDGERYEALEWLTAQEAASLTLDEDVDPRDSRGREYFIMAVVMVDTHLGWAYPNRAADLMGHLEDAGCPRAEVLDAIVMSVRMNNVLRSRDEASQAGGQAGDQAVPILVALATPSRRVAADRLAHVVAWKIDELGIEAVELLRRIGGLETPSAQAVQRVSAYTDGWIDTATIAWVRVHEMRPEVTRRRDEGTSSVWLRDKRILLLGAGAIGAVVAEQVVRAGAERLVVVDNGLVTPGILVRQPYYDGDIGEMKVDALAARLNQIVRLDVVEPVAANCHQLLLDGRTGGADAMILDLLDFDLVIDATADAGTRAVIERVRIDDRNLWPPVLTMLLGHLADRGLAVLSGRGSSSGSHELLRRFAVRGRGPASSWRDLVEDFYPDPPRNELFLPEPGCSEPTFIGSAGDVAAVASAMMRYGLNALADIESGIELGSESVRMRVGGFRLVDPATSIRRRAGAEEMVWHDDLSTVDAGTGFEIRITAEALAEMRSEVRRGARARGPRVETGGMMLGTIDEATMTVTVDVATGPAPDSLLSESYFLHGVEGTQQYLDSVRRTSKGLTRFVGLWHCHPYGRAMPSQTDKAGITVLTSFTPGARRALMVILAGDAARWDAWVEHGRVTPEAFVQVVTSEVGAGAGSQPESAPEAGPGSGLGADGTAGGPADGRRDGPVESSHGVLTAYQSMLQRPPLGEYFAGGYTDRSSRRYESGEVADLQGRT